MARKRATPLITDFDNIPADTLIPEGEQPYEIPSHWKWVRLGGVCHVNPPKPDVKAIADDCEVTFVPMPAVSEVTGSIVTPEKRALGAVKRGYTAFRAGDVLFAKITPCMENGKTAVVDSDTDGIAYGSTEFFVLRPGECLDAYLLHAFLRQESFRLEARAVMTGAVGQQRVPRDFLEELPFPLPPIDEQKTIVEKLQATNQKIDDVLERLDQFLDQAPQQRAAIIQAGVTGTLTKSWREEHSCTMDTWLNTTVQGIGQVVTGGTPPTKDPSNYGPGIAFVKPTDLNQGRHVVGAEAALSAIGAERSRVLPPNSVAMCCIGATITKAGLIEVESATNQQINAVVPNDDSDPVFIYYLFESTRFKQKVLENSSATTLPIVNKGRFSKLPVSVPPKKEQAEIATKVDAAMASAERAVEVATVVKSQLELTKSVVRMRALRGLV